MAILTAVLLVTATSGCAEEKQPAPPAIDRMSLRLNFTEFPDGPPPDKWADAPVKMANSENDPGTQWRIEAGKLTSDPTLPERSASYYSSPKLDAPITVIGARWIFIPKGETNSGAVGIIISDRVLRPPFPLHLSVTSTKWTYGVWAPVVKGKRDPTLQTIKSGNFDPPLNEDGTTPYEVQVTIKDAQAELKLPNGETQVITDQRIAEWPGRYGTFEAWARNGQTDARIGFTEIWAEAR